MIVTGERHFSYGSHLNARDRKAVNKTVSGLMKIVHAHGEVTKEELAELVEVALEGRRRVKEQSQRRFHGVRSVFRSSLMVRRETEERTMTELVRDCAEGELQRRRILAAVELSKARWVVALRLPHLDKISLFEIAGGDVDRLLGLLERARAAVASGFIACWYRGAFATACWIQRASR